jgi:fructose-1,6-bisphosphatase/inositol monophosphatase family enzyme
MIDSFISVGAVIELLGQHLHDVIPGAYLAKKAGAILTTLDGKEIEFGDYLKNPVDGKITYILANSKKTWEELVVILRAEPETQAPTSGLPI